MKKIKATVYIITTTNTRGALQDASRGIIFLWGIICLAHESLLLARAMVLPGDQVMSGYNQANGRSPAGLPDWVSMLRHLHVGSS